MKPNASTDGVKNLYWLLVWKFWRHMQCRARLPEPAGYTCCTKVKLHFGPHVNWKREEF